MFKLFNKKKKDYDIYEVYQIDWNKVDTFDKLKRLTQMIYDYYSPNGIYKLKGKEIPDIMKEYLVFDKEIKISK